MKKTMLVVAVLLCAFALFADNNSANLSLSPYTLQIVTKDGSSAQVSSYGVGAEFTYRRAIAYGIFAQGGFGWDTYIYANKDEKAYTNVMFFAGVGYEYKFTSPWSVEAHLDVADDVAFHAGETSDAVAVRVGLGCGYDFSNSFRATFKVDGTFGFASKDGANYVRYRVTPMFGCTYSF